MVPPFFLCNLKPEDLKNGGALGDAGTGAAEGAVKKTCERYKGSDGDAGQ